MRKSLMILLLVAGLAFGQTTKKKSGKAGSSPAAGAAAVIVAPDNIKWGDAPPVFSPGAQLAVLSGDPGKPGPYVVRLKVPDGYKIMPHWHPTQENVTVVSGEFHVGMGDKFTETGMQALSAGSFAAMPPHHNHYAMAKGETIVQVHGTGPFKLNYVNPTDDPSKKK